MLVLRFPFEGLLWGGVEDREWRIEDRKSCDRRLVILRTAVSHRGTETTEAAGKTLYLRPRKIVTFWVRIKHLKTARLSTCSVHSVTPWPFQLPDLRLSILDSLSSVSFPYSAAPRLCAKIALPRSAIYLPENGGELRGIFKGFLHKEKRANA